MIGGSFVTWISGLATAALPHDPVKDKEPRVFPTVVELLQGEGNFISFTHREHPGNRIGYRFHEHSPYVLGAIPTAAEQHEIEAVSRLETEFAGRPGAFKNAREVREAGWIPQDWTFYIAPASEGFDLLWVVQTHESGLNTYYAVQQCFRMSGATNEAWRRKVAETPAFSEFDLWATQKAAGDPLTSLSYVHSGGRWLAIPATQDTLGFRTRLGFEMDTARTGGNLKAATYEPYNPAFSDEVLDTGLAARTDAKGEWICALYWEHTTHVTDHHPADCLHAVVNLGPLAPQSKRAIRGKIYWFKGSLDDLYTKWQADFHFSGVR
ncbi:MAG: hypothetical protein HY706_08000 [Candidatus Hydrogenedentes bacterium]|nr:hypothetical protein [Candidatus Hydrogenedentota bacterium]